MSAVIYNYFEAPNLISLNEDKMKNYGYVCKICKAKNKKIKGEFLVIKAAHGVTSNLISHLKTSGHEIEYDEYVSKQIELCTPNSKKRRRLDCGSPIHFNLMQSPKYINGSVKQKDR
jgi:hypothetical protein